MYYDSLRAFKLICGRARTRSWGFMTHSAIRIISTRAPGESSYVYLIMAESSSTSTSSSHGSPVSVPVEESSTSSDEGEFEDVNEAESEYNSSFGSGRFACPRPVYVEQKTHASD